MQLRFAVGVANRNATIKYEMWNEILSFFYTHFLDTGQCHTVDPRRTTRCPALSCPATAMKNLGRETHSPHQAGFYRFGLDFRHGYGTIYPALFAAVPLGDGRAFRYCQCRTYHESGACAAETAWAKSLPKGFTPLPVRYWCAHSPRRTAKAVWQRLREKNWEERLNETVCVGVCEPHTVSTAIHCPPGGISPWWRGGGCWRQRGRNWYRTSKTRLGRRSHLLAATRPSPAAEFLEKAPVLARYRLDSLLPAELKPPVAQYLHLSPQLQQLYDPCHNRPWSDSGRPVGDLADCPLPPLCRRRLRPAARL